MVFGEGPARPRRPEGGDDKTRHLIKKGACSQARPCRSLTMDESAAKGRDWESAGAACAAVAPGARGYGSIVSASCCATASPTSSVSPGQGSSQESSAAQASLLA